MLAIPLLYLRVVVKVEYIWEYEEKLSMGNRMEFLLTGRLRQALSINIRNGTADTRTEISH